MRWDERQQKRKLPIVYTGAWGFDSHGQNQ